MDRQSSGDAVRWARMLRELRSAAGNPSFRAMAGRSGRISHTTLYEAASGSRFPSWETTREFVRVCGGDEPEWRARWERARSGNLETGTPGGLLRRLVEGSVSFAVAGLTATIAVSVGRAGPEAGNGAAAGPLIAGDSSDFLGDVTIPDGTRVRANSRFVKVWSLENAGSVAWRNRYLQAQHEPGGLVPARVPIGDTDPGERVMISVPVLAPSTPGTFWSGWKMVDEAGRSFFASYRPVYFFVTVV
ncbi:NBR1-Ig-like domain-containing protein [Longispora sp. K20-0274]|uniref:NBR1-Ig-like domain-containing protein n=1 Tax=Longispora sp. K20-0274 TaxID=3088255 RepID=UPI00399C115C